MNKIEVWFNAALPPTSLYNIFYIVNIYRIYNIFYIVNIFRIVLQKLKIGSRQYESIFHVDWKYSFFFYIYLMYFIILCRVSKICDLTYLVKRALHFQFHELMLGEFSIR